MKLIIDIPEDEYIWLKEHPNSIRWSSVYTDSILNGTPLEEHCDSCVFYHEESEEQYADSN